MKKLICLILAIILSNCEISPRRSVAQSSYGDVLINLPFANVYNREVVIHNMKYLIVYNGKPDAIFVINLTKDSLEVELLKKQLK